ncbi:hypothetical protein PAAG_12270 [Paracoccidioides lutzii Pb01]|uniref:Uncharacterized protein n=1 Tax=Paracoccidioides lutzii (strain ATCC MYA-826 / Pb01) TaxID=502779 RepID=A0A0A2UZU0_PARBA|nr:hypothetical protein PAAG_12270 [Paracoccidioides lutzii Pb01]KGQ01076.1 hypothetical protein PAAG_12270 [Paracoccidioides lutzii Pb01]
METQSHSARPDARSVRPPVEKGQKQHSAAQKSLQFQAQTRSNAMAAPASSVGAGEPMSRVERRKD